ncbi:MAG: anti-sigma factor [Candidatus Palauibacterales bacterium]|nr:anti-sigma factor [Candidatus Palauibacterales bacterium]MDP2529145.1 anti-sigma factor [Candidatus Palauibacterales bacterium]MDP2583908.1 anti-sigma factor [Candidatus Palauibacterales bacterium]
MAGYSCGEARRRLDAYVDGELSEEEARGVEGHLADCERCAEVLRFERTLLDGLKERIRETDVPPGLRERIESALERDHEAPADATETRSEG